MHYKISFLVSNLNVDVSSTWFYLFPSYRETHARYIYGAYMPKAPQSLASYLLLQRIDEDKLFNLFSIYGNIIRIKLLQNKPDHALVQMGDGFQAELAVHFLKVRRNFLFTWLWLITWLYLWSPVAYLWWLGLASMFTVCLITSLYECWVRIIALTLLKHLY